MTETPDPGLPTTPAIELPETDDPVVLRELLRQAREHLRLRESIERLMAENVARTEALLLEARATRPAPQADPDLMRGAIGEARDALAGAIAAIDRLGTLLDTPPAPDAAAPPSGDSPGGSPATRPEPAPRTVEVLLHEVHSPALARSLQQHLQGIDGVSRAEVRELAEGLLRITVESARSLDGGALAGWEPRRARTVRTARPDVLEIELGAEPSPVTP